MKKIAPAIYEGIVRRLIQLGDKLYEYDFTDAVEDGFVIADSYPLPKEQFLSALRATLEELGDTTVYISKTEGSSEEIKNGMDWEITLAELIELDPRQYTETEIYSTAGEWIIKTSHEGIAGIGGTRDFIQRLKKHYPQWEQERQKLVTEGNRSGVDYLSSGPKRYRNSKSEEEV